ncbi:MAG: 2-oxopent-4-enoate hydratase, partial [Synergistaceae bacterium]|nr:2-oxopent-4-enoate hydratase [Synergistaceae bacterium]
MLNMEKKDLAALLLKAQKEAIPVPSKYRQDFTLEEAYGVQICIKEAKGAQGRRVVGKKIGFTGRGMRRQFGIDTPDYGNLFDDQMFVQGTTLDTVKFVKPRVEGEIAFLLKKDLAGPSVTVYDVLDATQGVMACLEFVDSRWDFDITFMDSIADNGGCGGFLLGSRMLDLKGLDLRYIAMFMTKNGELMYSGTGVEVMGDPLNAVVWLTNKLTEHGTHLKAGDI